MLRTPLAAAISVTALLAADPYCPAYPREQRQLDLTRLEAERTASSLPRKGKPTGRRAAAAFNLIDNYVFYKMEQAGVPNAPSTNDAEFLRRVTLDLTGRIPTPDEVRTFLADENPAKRNLLIDSLTNSAAYTDNWTLFYANLFEVSSRYYNYIGIPGRNLFNAYLRDFVARDRSYKDTVSEMIAGSGDTFVNGPVNFIARGFQQGDPVQDTWDYLTDRVTHKLLGVKSECISCHDGRNHLEPINLWLSRHKREQFWRQSAFFSRMNLAFVPVDAFGQQNHGLISDRSTGGYSSVVNTGSPGPRPYRSGGPYSPAYIFTGEVPRSGDWRKELARMVTSDRQFARAAVNYIWAHFFTAGIVDPADAWDLARVDPDNPPPAPWTLQPSHPELLEKLADEFIGSNYSVRTIVRLIAQSQAYQLSSRYTEEWKPEYSRYFAKHTPRRLSAEEVFDAITAATMTEVPMFVEGFDQPLLRAVQLPDPSEPRSNGTILTFLNNFGRGDWWQTARNSRTTVLQVLYLMNDAAVNFRTVGAANGSPNTRVAQLMRSPASDAEAVTQLYLATLGRYPSDDELAAASRLRTGTREQWLSDVQWTLLNKLDFIFNY